MSLTERVHILTLGCPKNEADSRAMGDRLAAFGLQLVPSPDEATVLVVNTCSFIEAATEESIDVVLEAARTWKPAREGRRLVVAGCLPARYGEDLSAELPEVDAFVPVADEAAIAEILQRGSGPIAGTTDAPSRPAGPYEYLNVCDGCDRACTFCTIPTIRGPFASRRPQDVLGEAERLLTAGARELVLVGQDVSSYSSGSTDLAALLGSLAGLQGLGWLRVMYVQPDGVTDRLLEVLAGDGPFARYLDIPFQHASGPVLRAMGRRGDADAHLALVHRVRTVMPDVALRSTFITGFPGETEEDADLLESFIAEAHLDHVGVFAFSLEEGTAAADLPDRVPHQIALERARAVSRIADEVALGRFRELVGSTLDVLVDGVEDGAAVGRWYGQAPEVDGVVTLDRSIPAGTFVRARVEDAVGHDLIAKVER